MQHPDRKDILLQLYESAVAAAQPARCLPPCFPPPPVNGRLIVLGCGKAASAMARAAEDFYQDMIRDGRFTGLVTTRRGYGLPLAAFETMEGGHPAPDEGSAAAAERALALAAGAGRGDLVLVLISGGASALWAAPAPGLTLADKQTLTRALLAAGAPIHDINCVRKHLSRIKGGRLARAVAQAAVVTLAISDVPGDAPATIGSGPAVPDETTLADARAALVRWGLTPAPAILAALEDERNETPKPGDPALEGARFILAATPGDAIAAAAARAAAAGYAPVILGDALEGEARGVAREHAALALAARKGDERCAIISGGELTVTVAGEGRGGPNQEYALALAIALDGAPGICALAANTDGADGAGRPDDPAGAFVTPDTIQRAINKALDPAAFLAKNDSTTFFEVIDDLVVCGATSTNVNDFRVILVEPE